MDKDEVAALVREVRYLRDRQDILDCINNYGRGLDRLDADLIRDAFHPDATDNHGPFLGGVDAFVPFAIDCEAAFLNTHHGITSHNCEIKGDTAHAESYVFWFVQMPDGEKIGAGGGRYIDKLERREGKWKVSLRRLLMDWTFQVPEDKWLGDEWSGVKGERDKTDPSYLRPMTIPPA
ncbi:nuclear transport factor 2 family protein [Parasphingopyxis marina]|nr:nuclear transport factor 2 family protein [Parasphingopyxis marina]